MKAQNLRATFRRLKVASNQVNVNLLMIVRDWWMKSLTNIKSRRR